jgi:hypothetical protein
MVRGLLSEDRLNGSHPIIRDVGPELYAFLVDAANLEDARQVIRRNCEAWGGGMWPLLPFEAGANDVAPAWEPLLDDATVDAVIARDFLDADDYRARLRDVRLDNHHAIEPIWSITEAYRLETGHRAQLAVDLPRPDDAWFVSYLACFGELETFPTAGLLEQAGFRNDLVLADLVDVHHGPLTAPGAENLVRALRAAAGFPRRLSLRALGIGSAPWSQDLQGSPTWTNRHWTRQFVGSNIAVIYEPGSVPDLCLIWNLRAAHGLPEGLPLGIPNGDDVIAGLRSWGSPEQGNDAFAGRLRGFGRPFALTSLSVGFDRLQEIAEAAGTPWRAIDSAELMRAPHRASRRSRDVASFTDGTAVVNAVDRPTNDLFAHRSRWAHGLDVQVRVTVERDSVPPLPALRNDYAFDAGWRDGGFDTGFRSDGAPVTVEWPSGWAMLRAAVEPTGLKIRPSAAGSASAALVRRMGDFRAIDLLRDTALLDLLDDLARRRGISWFRNEVRRLARRAAEDDDAPAMARIEEQLRQLTVTGSDDEPSLLTVSDLSRVLKGAPARSWVEWAERGGLLVRGIQFCCERCKASGWRTVAELAPPIVCGGCGEAVERPFAADTLQFRYRPSQSLLEVMSADALPHLLCSGWFVALFHDGLVGVHPGVEFLDVDKQVIAEADVVLLFRSGQVALVECKRRAAGLKQADVDKLENLADMVDALFTCYATPQFSWESAGLWQQLRRDLPDRRRITLFGEHLLRNSYDVVSLMGVDVTDPASGDDGDANARHEAFIKYLHYELGDEARKRRLEDHVLARGD